MIAIPIAMDSPCVPCVFLPFISIPSATALFSEGCNCFHWPYSTTVEHWHWGMPDVLSWARRSGWMARVSFDLVSQQNYQHTVLFFSPIKMAIFWASDILSQVMCVAFSPDGELLATASTVSQRRSRYFLFFHCLNTLKPNIWKKRWTIETEKLWTIDGQNLWVQENIKQATDSSVSNSF